jgi:prevent-host-death family protein
MKTVNISDLKAKLSAHLRIVRNGEEVLVCDRNKPVARIVPVQLDKDEQRRRLIARGVLIPPRKRRPKSMPWPRPTGKKIPDEVIEQVWREEREGR